MSGVRVGNSNIDFKGLQIDGPSGSIAMEVKVMKLLRVLVDNAGEVMTRDELIMAVWGVEHGGDESLSRGISLLRKALGDKRGKHTNIVTIPRVGYRLIAEIDNSEQPKVSFKSRPLSAPDVALKGKSRNRLAMSIGVIFTSLLLFAFVVSTVRNSGSGSIQSKLETGFAQVEGYMAPGAIEASQKGFRSVLEQDPDNTAARGGLALAIFREYTHLERDPALLEQGRGHAEAALRADEHLAVANIAVAWAAEFDGDFDRALQYLDRADILESENVLALEGRYRTHKAQRNLEKAEATLNRAISQHPQHALFYSYRGHLHDLKDDPIAAEKDFRTAISLSPDWAHLYAQLAHSLYSQGRTTEAIDVIQNGLKIDETALLYNNLGTYLFFQGQYALAASAFEKTIMLKGDSHDYLYWANLGDAYRWSQNKTEEAATNYKRALQLLSVQLETNPNDSNLKSRAAMFNAKLGNLDEAQKYMDSFVLTPESPTIQLYRAVVTYEILANRKQALTYLGDVIAQNYPMTEILHDPELAQLRQDPAYHRLLAETQSD